MCWRAIAKLLPSICLFAGAQLALADDVIIYRCTDSAGHVTYRNQPINNSCKVVPKFVRTPIPLYYHDSACTVDCSGHEAGYAWAEEHNIRNPDHCGGRSLSFVEGCIAWVEENQDESDSDDLNDDDPDRE